MYKNIEKTIALTLIRLGISPNSKGYHYLRIIIPLCMFDRSLTSNFSKNIYPEVAAQFSVTAVSVERAIRHSINLGWHLHDKRLADEIFGNSIQSDKDVPTNTLFISAITEWLIYTV